MRTNKLMRLRILAWGLNCFIGLDGQPVQPVPRKVDTHPLVFSL